MSALADIRKCLRTIRLDASDSFVFARAAEGGEWALPGSFLFVECDQNAIDAMSAKERAAFRSGFLGVRSFGWSTLAVVTEIRPDEVDALARELAQAFVERLGAPDVATAMPAAEEEILASAALCDHPVNTLIALHRSLEAEGLRERFRTLTPKSEAGLAETGKGAFRAFEFVEVEGEDEPEERVDLLELMKGKG